MCVVNVWISKFNDNVKCVIRDGIDVCIGR